MKGERTWIATAPTWYAVARLAPANMLLLGIVLVAVAWTGLARDARATSPARITFWTRCPLEVTVASVEVGPVEVLRLTCAQARQAIQSARIALTPGGPVFSTTGYTCRSRIILPRFDPSPIELPAVESCIDASHHRLSFIWNFAS
jgi:hypothetical protein